jgi:hypothetical protein
VEKYKIQTTYPKENNDPKEEKLMMQIKSSDKIKKKYQQRFRRLSLNLANKKLCKEDLIEGIKEPSLL